MPRDAESRPIAQSVRAAVGGAVGGCGGATATDTTRAGTHHELSTHGQSTPRHRKTVGTTTRDVNGEDANQRGRRVRGARRMGGERKRRYRRGAGAEEGGNKGRRSPTTSTSHGPDASVQRGDDNRHQRFCRRVPGRSRSCHRRAWPAAAAPKTPNCRRVADWDRGWGGARTAKQRGSR
ncbi:hypothetical protein BU14_0147s0032 [Porphyra umbilicalis]|uniref:Uncharacterized protein n=1 Tax=Porphyra umbilicalis TaxID=2786 RepID=A0A1X6P9K1_PORUM|nr:hypothetical protein BU14_0147s0032 [Porphyra umbilicalis]|eukprot:OSX77507.1 hypothetical protein BU14_0147s0032 [Porphyra umbilicalis]